MFTAEFIDESDFQLEIETDAQPTESQSPEQEQYLDTYSETHIESFVKGKCSPTPTNVIYTINRVESITPSVFVVEMPEKGDYTETISSDALAKKESDDLVIHDIEFESEWKSRSLHNQSLVCPRCNNTYKNANHLRRHVQYECGKSAAMVCTRCHAKFKRPDSLRRHMQVSCQRKTKVPRKLH